MLHDQISAIVFDLPVEHLGDVGMIELRSHPGFSREQLAKPARELGRFVGEIDDLDRDPLWSGHAFGRHQIGKLLSERGISRCRALKFLDGEINSRGRATPEFTHRVEFAEARPVCLFNVFHTMPTLA